MFLFVFCNNFWLKTIFCLMLVLPFHLSFGAFKKYLLCLISSYFKDFCIYILDNINFSEHRFQNQHWGWEGSEEDITHQYLLPQIGSLVLLRQCSIILRCLPCKFLSLMVCAWKLSVFAGLRNKIQPGYLMREFSHSGSEKCLLLSQTLIWFLLPAFIPPYLFILLILPQTLC